MKLIASDFDETLKRNRKVSLEDKKAIRRMQKDGNCFLIVSGRNYDMLKDALWFFHVPYDYLILANGALIMDKNHKIIYRRKMDPSIAQILKDEVHKRKVLIAGFTDGVRYSVLKHANSLRGIIRALVLGVRKTREEEIPLEDIASFYILSDEKNTEEIYQKYESNELLSVVKNVSTIVDIQGAHTDKSTALFFLKDLLNAEEVYAIGDSHNDLKMITEHIGIAMANGEKEVRDAAQYVVRDFTEVEKIVNHEKV